MRYRRTVCPFRCNSPCRRWPRYCCATAGNRPAIRTARHAFRFTDPNVSRRRLPARRELRRSGHQFCRLCRQRRAGRAVSVRCQRAPGAAPPVDARLQRRGLARLSARSVARTAVRLPRTRTLPAGSGPSLQRQQAVARSVCARARRRAAVERCALRLAGHLTARGPVIRSSRQRLRGSQGGRHGRAVRLGRGSGAAHGMDRHRHLRSPFARL